MTEQHAIDSILQLRKEITRAEDTITEIHQDIDAYRVGIAHYQDKLAATNPKLAVEHGGDPEDMEAIYEFNKE